MSFEPIRIDKQIYYIIPSFANTGLVRHCFTTRLGGNSPIGLNLGFRVNDDTENVMKNYETVANDMGFDYKNMVLSRQTHGTNIRIVTLHDAGKGISVESDIFDTDGLVTNIPNIPLVIFFADCVPLMFLDPQRRVVAVAHAGWRGTVDKIGAKTVKIMQDEFSCNPSDILVGIGSSIGVCCFEVEEDTAQYFEAEFIKENGGGKYHIDLWKANRKQLTDVGVRPDKIFLSNECTMCKSDIYYSYRAHRENTGRMGAIIELL